MPLSSARRVVLLSYNPVTHTIDFRHFLISVRPVGVSKPIRKLIAGSSNNKVGAGAGSLGGASSGPSLIRKRRAAAAGLSAESGTEEEDDEDGAAGGGWQVKNVGGGAGAAGKGKGIVDLSRASDISDYILRHEGMGFVTSDSEMSDMSDAGGSINGGSDSEMDEKRGKVRLAGDYVGRGNRGKAVRGDKRAVRLVELGPRMELGLFKVEEGVGEGEVLFHEMGK